MMSGVVRPLFWVGSSLEDLRSFPPRVKRLAGYALYRIQQGQIPSDQRPMPAVGDGVIEIRVRTGQEHRVFYTARFGNAIYVLHAFEKKTQRTPRKEIHLARARYREVLRFRQRVSRRGGVDPS